jgi:hypothetical protein
LKKIIMTESDKELAKAATVTGVGAGVGTAGGATVGVLELAASTGSVSALSAGLVIGAGAAAGGLLAYGIYRLVKKRKA